MIQGSYGTLMTQKRIDMKLNYDILTPREEKIVRMFYGVNYSKSFTLEEISKEMALDVERTELIKDRAIRKLKQGNINE